MTVINIHFNETTDSVKIFNNTLVGKGNQEHLVNISKKLNSLISVQRFSMRNNIFYKEGTTHPDAIKFDNIDIIPFNNDILNNNLYFYNNGTPTLRIGSVVYMWNQNLTKWEHDGKEGDPLFESLLADDFRIGYESPAKNLGIGLQGENIKSDYDGNPRPYWNKDFDIGAFEIEDTQLKIGVEGDINDETYTFNLTSLGTYWEKSGGSWIISTDQSLQSRSYEVIGNTPTDTNEWKGFEYNWLLRSGSQFQNYRIGSGFYKLSLTIEEHEIKHFYLDLRDAVTAYSPNIYIKYFIDYEIGQQKFQYLNINKSWQDISNGDILRIWNIRNGNYNTDDLDLYWENALVQLNGIGQHPRLVWGPANAELFEIQNRLDNSSWQNLDFSSILEYIDYNIIITSPNTTHQNLYYRLRKDQTEEYTNEVQVLKPLIEKEKSKNQILSFKLYQNYPNPFNPSTTIAFTLPDKMYVKLKIYDIRGREIKKLVDNECDSGLHNVEFNGSDLSSGVYFYQMLAGSFTETKKFHIVK